MLQETRPQETGNSGLIRRVNESIVLDVVRNNSPLSRSEIVRRSSLAYPTVSRAINALADKGFLRLLGEGESQGGRRPQLWEFDPSAGVIIGAQLERSSVRVGAFNLGKELLETKVRRLDVTAPEYVVAEITRSIQEVLKCQGYSLDQLIAVGIGSPGAVHPDDGSVMSPYVLRWSTPFSLREHLEQQLHVPVFVENDINAAALGETWIDKKPKADPLIYISISSGVGAGIVFKGEIFHGLAGGAGELGHFSVDSTGEVCECGNRGCLENYISTPVIGSRLKVSPNAAAPYRELKRQLDLGDEMCCSLCEEIIDRLSVVIANLVNLLNPATIVLGGDIAALGQTFLFELRRRAEAACGMVQFSFQNLVLTQLGSHGGIYGGAALADQRVFQRPRLELAI